MLRFVSAHDIEKPMLWSFFKSVKLAVVLLITLAVAAIVGTVVPQGEDAIRFAMKLDPKLFRIFSLLGLFDVYHTIWFRSILGLLCLNLIVCSLDRFPKTWKRIRSSPPVDASKVFENIDETQLIRIKADFSKWTEKIASILKKRFKHIRSKIKENSAFYYVEEGWYSHMGVYLVHASVIIIILGSIVGSIWGFEGYMNIIEGEKKNILRLTRKMKFIRLPFYVKLNKFIVEYYKNGIPKEYESELVFIQGHKQVKKRLRVNHPVSFQGIMFYQASYGISVGNKASIKIINADSNQVYETELVVGKPYQIPGSKVTIRLLDIKEDFAKVGPALILAIKKGARETRLILFKNPEAAKKRLPKAMLDSPIFNSSSVKPYTFVVKNIPARYYSGLQVSKDPGVPLVWFGFFILILGLIITFFTSHKRIWIRILKKDKFLEISVAGISNKDPVSLSKKIGEILKAIKEASHV